MFNQQTNSSSNSTIEAIEKGVKCVQSYEQRHQNDVINFEHILHLFVVFLLLALNREMLAG